MPPSFCTVTHTINSVAVSGALSFEPIPGQVIDGEGLEQNIIASVSGKIYSASLVRKARYRVRTALQSLPACIIRIPDTGTATLADLIPDLARG
jgi:hypothetical protein